MADESYVQVAGDGTGKKVRNLVLGRIILDGVGVPPADANTTNYYVQVTALADAEGRLIQPEVIGRDELLIEQQKTNELLALILEALER